MHGISYVVNVVKKNNSTIYDIFNRCRLIEDEKLILSFVGVKPVKLEIPLNDIKEINITISDSNFKNKITF